MLSYTRSSLCSVWTIANPFHPKLRKLGLKPLLENSYMLHSGSFLATYRAAVPGYKLVYRPPIYRLPKLVRCKPTELTGGEHFVGKYPSCAFEEHGAKESCQEPGGQDNEGLQVRWFDHEVYGVLGAPGALVKEVYLYIDVYI